ncbi:MAG: archaeosortase/exosortase family protein [Candidatus Aenigmarchaeota archaeon]|nr:archaeosortase/exosortase family protein [Candidatus Aenigmarchaeota archaeon]
MKKGRARRKAAKLPSVKKPGRTKLTRDQQKLWETFMFLVKVLVLSIPLYFIILFSISLAPMQQADATVSSAILRAMGYAVQQDGAYITVGTQKPFSFYLTEDCTAWKSILFLFALIFAVPKIGMKRRIIGLGAGIPVLWLGNQARILGVVLTERVTSVQFAMFTHDFFWRVFLVFLVIGLWLVWMKPPALNHKIYPKRLGIRPRFRMKNPFPRLITKKSKK